MFSQLICVCFRIFYQLFRYMFFRYPSEPAQVGLGQVLCCPQSSLPMGLSITGFFGIATLQNQLWLGQVRLGQVLPFHYAERQVDHQVDSQVDHKVDRQLDSQADHQADHQVDRQADHQVDGQADCQADCWADRWVDRQPPFRISLGQVMCCLQS